MMRKFTACIRVVMVLNDELNSSYDELNSSHKLTAITRLVRTLQ